MKRVKLIKAIEALGCEFVRHGAKHDWYRNPATGFRSQFLAIGSSKGTWHGTSSRC